MNVKMPRGLQQALRILAASHERNMSAEIRFLIEKQAQKELKPDAG